MKTETTFFSDPIHYVGESRVGKFVVETGSTLASKVKAVALKVFEIISAAIQATCHAVLHPIETGGRVVRWIEDLLETNASIKRQNAAKFAKFLKDNNITDPSEIEGLKLQLAWTGTCFYHPPPQES